MNTKCTRTEAITQLLHSPALRASISRHQHVVYYNPSKTSQHIDCEFGFDRLHDIINTLAEPHNYRFMHCSAYQRRYFDLYFLELSGIISTEPSYRRLDVGEVKELINYRSEWSKFRKALKRLLKKHDITPEPKLENCLTRIEEYRQALAGRGGFRLIKFFDTPENYDLDHPTNKSFDNEPEAFRYVLENICVQEGLVIGEANVAEFVRKGGDALLYATVPAARRSDYVTEMRELVKSEPWLFPAAAQNFNAPAVEK